MRRLSLLLCQILYILTEDDILIKTQSNGTLTHTSPNIIKQITVMGFGFFMMARKSIWVPCVILAAVWLCHIIYFCFRGRTIQPGEDQ